MTKLHPDTLTDLDQRIDTPSYDRDQLQRRIVHIGVGGFHRAHLATYVDDLCRSGSDGWAIIGAGTLQGDARMADALSSQDGLYTLVLRGEDEVAVRVIGSIVDYVHAHPDPAPLAQLIADPETQIVSLTVTEGGYPVDDDTGEFAPESPNAEPGSAFATIVEGLRRRREGDAGPVTVLSCDNVIGNGHHARVATLGVAAAVSNDLADWIAQHITFPNSMVDRITPATTDEDRQWLADVYGVEDAWPVMAEPFRQWVVEDNFAGARLPLEDLDVIVTDDVEPYELFKLRLLNAGHSVLAYLARLVGHELVDQVLAEERFVTFLWQFLDDEAGPVVPSAPGIDLEDYKEALVRRFSNPAVSDQVDRLCQDGTSKLPKFVLPTVREQLAAGGQIELCALALAAWCQYLLGVDEDGNEFDIANDGNFDDARAHADKSREDPAAFLSYTAVFGTELAEDDALRRAFTAALTSIRERGVRATLDAWLG